jgi:hypothetical protein
VQQSHRPEQSKIWKFQAFLVKLSEPIAEGLASIDTEGGRDVGIAAEAAGAPGQTLC